MMQPTTMSGAIPMRSLTRALALALTFAWLIASPISAQELSNLRLGEAESGSGAFGRDDEAVFAAGTQRLYVLFDYEDASRHRMGVGVTAPGGLPVFEDDQLLSGDGTATFELDGSEMFRSIAGNLSEYGDATEQNAQDLADTGNRAYVSTIDAATGFLANSIRLMEIWSLPNGPARDLDDLSSAVANIEDLIVDLRALDVDDDEGRKALAPQVLTEAELIAEAAESLQDYAADVSDLAIPESEAELATSYVLEVTINGSPSMSMEFWVTDERLPEATATNRPPPTREPSATIDPSQPTRTPRPTRESDDDVDTVTGSERTDVENNPTAAARATEVAGILSEEATVEAETAPTRLAQAGATSQNGGDPEGDADAASESGQASDAANQQEPGAGATWTPVAGDGSGGTDSDDSDDASVPDSDGPNLAVLGLGILALAAIAIWLRRRV